MFNALNVPRIKTLNALKKTGNTHFTQAIVFNLEKSIIEITFVMQRLPIIILALNMQTQRFLLELDNSFQKWLLLVELSDPGPGL